MAHPNTSTLELPEGPEGPLVLEVHQNLEILASQGRLRYKKLYRLSDPSSPQGPSRRAGLELLVALSLLVDREILVLVAPSVLFCPGAPAIQETLYHLGLRLRDPPGVLDLPVFQEVHPGHVVPVALEILAAHQDPFLLSALSLLIQPCHPFLLYCQVDLQHRVFLVVLEILQHPEGPDDLSLQATQGAPSLPHYPVSQEVLEGLEDPWDRAHRHRAPRFLFLLSSLFFLEDLLCLLFLVVQGAQRYNI